MSKENARKIELRKAIFYLAYFLLLIASFAHRVTFVAPIVNELKIAIIALLLIVCLTQAKKYDVKTILIMIATVMLSAISAWVSSDLNMLWLFLVVFASKNIDNENFIKIDIIFKTIIVVLVAILSLNGLANSYDISRDGVPRYSLGFSHPNALGAIIAAIIIEYLYLTRAKNIRIIELILIAIISAAMVMITDSRTSLSIVIVAIVYRLIKKQVDRLLDNRAMKNIISSSWFLFAIISILAGMLYARSTQLGICLDEIFNTRVRWISYFMNEYGISLFGNKLLLISDEQAKLTSAKSLILDNGYVRFLLQYGVILFVYFGLLLDKTIKQAYKEKNYALAFLLFVFLIKGLSEHSLYILSSNVFLIYFNVLLFGKSIEGYKNGKVEKKN